jgi:hypothetical protein
MWTAKINLGRDTGSQSLVAMLKTNAHDEWLGVENEYACRKA